MDFDAIRKRLAALQNAQSNKSGFWKPTIGKQVIRLVPYSVNPEDPFIELLFHYNINGKTYLSPLSFGKPDPIQEFADKLKRTGEKEDWRAGKKMEPKLRTFAPVIVRGEENEGVRYWGFGKTVYTELLGFLADEMWGDITDPLTGRDITLEYISAEDAGQQYPVTKVRPHPDRTPLDTNSERATKFLTEQSDLVGMYTLPTYEELSEVLENWLNPQEEDTTAPAPEAQAPAPSAQSVSKIDDIESQFDELINSK